MGLDKLRAEPVSHASHHVSHARQMLVLSPFSFLRLLVAFGYFARVFAILALLSISFCYLPSSFSTFVKVSFVLLSLIFEKVQLQFLKLLKSSAKFLVKKQSGRIVLQLIGKKKSKMNSLQVEMHALLQFSI